MSRYQLTLWNDLDRHKAINWIKQAPKGFRMRLMETKRTVPQNDRMWAMLTIISTELIWHGKRWPPEAWKDHFMHVLHGGRFMPAEDGSMIPIGRSTSDLGKSEHSLLTEIIEGFAERQGIDLGEQTKRQAA